MGQKKRKACPTNDSIGTDSQPPTALLWQSIGKTGSTLMIEDLEAPLLKRHRPSARHPGVRWPPEGRGGTGMPDPRSHGPRGNGYG